MDLHKLSRPELLKTCKDLEIKGVNTLRKEEMIEKINEYYYEDFEFCGYEMWNPLDFPEN